MESVSALKSGERRLVKQLVSYTGGITLPQLFAWVLCFIFSRASIFGVLKPFSAAFYVSLGFTGLSRISAIMAVTLGNILFSNVYETIRQTVALLLFDAFSHIIFKIGGKRESVFSRSALMAALTGFTGILRGVVQGLHVYDLLISLLCAALVFSLAVIVSPAAETFGKERERFLFDNRTLLAKAILMGIAIISLEGVIIWGCELGSVVAGIAVIIIARRRGSSVGACTGAVLGMIIALYDLPSSLEIPGMLALAGAAAGLQMKTRTGAVTLWTLVVVMFSGLSILEGSLTIKYFELLASGILFMIIPQSLINFVSDELAGLKGSSGEVEARDTGMTHEAADRLFVLGKALSRVSRSIEETLTEDSEGESSVAEWIIEAVAEKICHRCSLCERCWGTHFIKTYKLVEKSISDLKLDESGQLEIPNWFKNTCTKSDRFIEALGTAYSLYKAENVWRKRLNESRMLLAKQAAMISGSVMTSARALMDASERDFEMEGRLLGVANGRGIPVTGFRYHNRQESKPYLEAIFDTKNKFSTSILDETVQDSIQTGLVRVGESRRDLMGYSVVRYMKQPRFKAATGIARASRESGMVSGDNFAFFISGDGYHISAISDGKGSGIRAERYSRTAIQMLENLIEDGIELNTAIRFLNLYLNIRGDHDRLATMDICAIDLSLGDVSFYKYGASPSYIKRSDGAECVDIEEKSPDSRSGCHYKPSTMKTGEFAVMVSDGIAEAFTEEGESVLQRFIEETETVNVQQLADSILKEAETRSKGKHDDMTVLVTKLW